MAGYGGDSVAEHCLERPKGRDLFKCGRVTLDPRYRVGFIGGERFEARGWLDATKPRGGKGFLSPFQRGITDFGRKVWTIGASEFFSIRVSFFLVDCLEGRRGEE